MFIRQAQHQESIKQLFTPCDSAFRHLNPSDAKACNAWVSVLLWLEAFCWAMSHSRSAIATQQRSVAHWRNSFQPSQVGTQLCPSTFTASSGVSTRDNTIASTSCRASSQGSSTSAASCVAPSGLVRHSFAFLLDGLFLPCTRSALSR